MATAGISGIRACARGLRHSYGVHAILSRVPVTSLQTWMGHTCLETTKRYLVIGGPEEDQIAERMWDHDDLMEAA